MATLADAVRAVPSEVVVVAGLSVNTIAGSTKPEASSGNMFSPVSFLSTRLFPVVNDRPTPGITVPRAHVISLVAPTDPSQFTEISSVADMAASEGRSAVDEAKYEKGSDVNAPPAVSEIFPVGIPMKMNTPTKAPSPGMSALSGLSLSDQKSVV